MKNKLIRAVAKELGVEMGEWFHLVSNDGQRNEQGPFRFNDLGMWAKGKDNKDWYSPHDLGEVVAETWRVEKIHG